MFEFRDGRAVLWRTYQEGIKIVLKGHFAELSSLQYGKYYESTDQISWKAIIVVTEGTATLDRRTLELTFETRHGEMESYGKCEVYQSLEKFQAFMEAQRMQGQQQIDEEMKGNKI